MNKKLIIILLLIVLITGCKKENYIKDSDDLYEEAVNYIVEKDTNPEKENDRYKMFTQYEKFGITKDEKYRYVYIWILEESYYVVDNKIISGSGSSMPYKFIFELDENKVVKVEVPEDGNRYISSIKKMYPDDIEKKVINFQIKNDDLLKEVRNYYKDIKDKNIYYYTGEEYIKLDK